MLDEFRLHVFMAVVREKSFTRAAEYLRISQPAVSQHISELEKLLGVKLFQRQRGLAAITPAGQVFMGYAESILSEYQRVRDMFLELPETTVSISASEDVYDYLMSEILTDFIAVHPQITFIKTFPDNADICVRLIPVSQNSGCFKFGAIPTEGFSRSRIWKLLSGILNCE